MWWPVDLPHALEPQELHYSHKRVEGLLEYRYTVDHRGILESPKAATERDFRMRPRRIDPFCETGQDTPGLRVRVALVVERIECLQILQLRPLKIADFGLKLSTRKRKGA